MQHHFRCAVMLSLLILIAGCDGLSSSAFPSGQGNEPGAEGEEATYPLCGPKSAPSLFKNAICICEDLRDVGAMLVRNGSTVDPATMGINGSSTLVNHTLVQGSLVSYKGLKAAANLDVGQDLTSQGHVSFTGRLKVGRDLMVGGNLSGVGWLDVGRVIGVSGSHLVLGGPQTGQLGAYQPPAGPPCDCDAGTVLDVAQEVADASHDNDNAKVGLPPHPSLTIGMEKLVLNTGRYFFGNKTSIGYSKITVNGAVQIYVDGNLDSIGHDRFQITPGSTLDLFISGSLRTIGHMVYGDHHHPSAFRLYIGGSDKASFQVGNQVFRGSVYAPQAALVYVGRTRIEGALLARTLDSVGLLELFFARPTTDSNGEKCQAQGGSAPPPSTPDDPPDPSDLPMLY